MTELPPFTPFAEFYARFDWRQGEHVTIVGPTGTGKTVLLQKCLGKRYEAGGAIAALITKPRDKNIEKWARRDHFTIERGWPVKPRRFYHRPSDIRTPSGAIVPWDQRLMIWPDGGSGADFAERHAAVHGAVMSDLFVQGNWCIVAEELHYLAAVLGLDKQLVTLWTQGRSNGISVIGGTQRPVNIPLYAYNNASHLFFFADNDSTNLKRIQGIGGMNENAIQNIVRGLPEYDFLYINVRKREMIRSRVPFSE